VRRCEAELCREYIRGTAAEPFREVARDAVCWGCHGSAATTDWVHAALLIWNDLSSMPTSSSILRVIGAMGEQSKRRSEGSIDG
jgi:hypothetical protein